MNPTIFVWDLFFLARFVRDFSSAREFSSPVAASPRSRRSQSSRHAGKKSLHGEEESSRKTTAARGEVAHDKESRRLGISKLPSHCAYAKMPSLVHQMPSLPKYISQMHNCWRAIFKVFGKFLECIVQLHNCWRCPNQILIVVLC